MRLRHSIFTGLSLLALASAAPAGEILQDAGFGSYQINYFEPIGQSFTAEDSYVTFGFYFQGMNTVFPNDPILLTLLSGDGTGGAVLTQSTFSLADDFTGYYDVDLSSVALTVGAQYTALLSVPGDSPYWGLQLNTGNGFDYYSGGRLIMGGNQYWPEGSSPDRADARFRVTPTTPPTPVPLPPTAALFVAGLIGLGFRRFGRNPGSVPA